MYSSLRYAVYQKSFEQMKWIIEARAELLFLVEEIGGLAVRPTVRGHNVITFLLLRSSFIFLMAIRSIAAFVGTHGIFLSLSKSPW
jgi:hypothetical protein